MQPHSSKSPLSGKSLDPPVPLGYQAPPSNLAPLNLAHPRKSRPLESLTSASRPLKSRAPRGSRNPLTLMPSQVSRFPSNLTTLRPSSPESRAPLQIPRPLMPLGSSALPQISRPLEVLGTRTPLQISWPLERARDPHAGQPAPTCPRDARQRWGPRKPRDRGVLPPVPDSLLAGLAVGGHGRALAPLGVHAAPSRRHQGPHLSGGAAGGACRSHSYPAPRASTP